MKAVVFKAPKENLSFIEKDKPTAAENQVVVKIKS